MLDLFIANRFKTLQALEKSNCPVHWPNTAFSQAALGVPGFTHIFKNNFPYFFNTFPILN